MMPRSSSSSSGGGCGLKSAKHLWLFADTVLTGCMPLQCCPHTCLPIHTGQRPKFRAKRSGWPPTAAPAAAGAAAAPVARPAHSSSSSVCQVGSLQHGMGPGPDPIQEDEEASSHDWQQRLAAASSDWQQQQRGPVGGSSQRDTAAPAQMAAVERAGVRRRLVCGGLAMALGSC